MRHVWTIVRWPLNGQLDAKVRRRPLPLAFALSLRSGFSPLKLPGVLVQDDAAERRLERMEHKSARLAHQKNKAHAKQTAFLSENYGSPPYNMKAAEAVAEARGLEVVAEAEAEPALAPEVGAAIKAVVSDPIVAEAGGTATEPDLEPEPEPVARLKPKGAKHRRNGAATGPKSKQQVGVAAAGMAAAYNSPTAKNGQSPYAGPGGGGRKSPAAAPPPKLEMELPKGLRLPDGLAVTGSPAHFCPLGHALPVLALVCRAAAASL